MKENMSKQKQTVKKEPQQPVQTRPPSTRESLRRAAASLKSQQAPTSAPTTPKTTPQSTPNGKTRSTATAAATAAANVSKSATAAPATRRSAAAATSKSAKASPVHTKTPTKARNGAAESEDVEMGEQPSSRDVSTTEAPAAEPAVAMDTTSAEAETTSTNAAEKPAQESAADKPAEEALQGSQPSSQKENAAPKDANGDKAADEAANGESHTVTSKKDSPKKTPPSRAPREGRVMISVDLDTTIKMEEFNDSQASDDLNKTTDSSNANDHSMSDDENFDGEGDEDDDDDEDDEAGANTDYNTDSAEPPSAKKAKNGKMTPSEKLRRRLPMSVKELIDYHSSNGKSIKDIVTKINAVCRTDEKVSYGYVQKYLYRKKLEATTAKKARYYRKKYGFVYRRMRRKPVLTENHRNSRIQWCMAHKEDNFDKDIFIGKTALKPFLASLNQLKGVPPDPNQPRQQTTLHLWGAISRKGASPLQIFDGALTTAMYLEILLENVVPFIAENFPNGHRFHQDNNPKHSAKLSQEFLESTGINWVKSPPRSHDLNPIELVWTDLIQVVAKRLPKTIGQVVVAVKDYWKTLTPEKCCEFIDKLVDIVPKVIERNGEWISVS